MLLTSILCVPLGVGLLCLVARPRALMEALNIAGFGIVLALGVKLVPAVLASPDGAVTAWSEFLRADALSAWMVLLIAAVSLATALYAVRYFRHDEATGALTARRVREFYVLTPVFTTGMLLVVLANNLGVMWAAVEVTALSSVLLVALYNRKTSLEAAWKYVMLGSLGLVLALFGTIFAYAAAINPEGGEALPSFNWSRLLAMAPQLKPQLVTLAFVFALVGYGTKAGLAPMHTWLPDAHSEAPSPTSAMLSGVSLKIAVYALLRFHILTAASLGPGFSQRLLLGFGLFSMVLAGPFILTQKNLKRLLAYSSLEHVGLICAAAGLNAPPGGLWRPAPHGVSRADKTGAVLRRRQPASALPHARLPADGPGCGPRAAGDRAGAGAGRHRRERFAAVWSVRERTDHRGRQFQGASGVGWRRHTRRAARGVLRHAQQAGQPAARPAAGRRAARHDADAAPDRGRRAVGAAPRLFVLVAGAVAAAVGAGGGHHRRHAMKPANPPFDRSLLKPGLCLVFEDLARRCGDRLHQVFSPRPEELYLHLGPGLAGAVCAALYRKHGARLAGVFAEDGRATDNAFFVYHLYVLDAVGGFVLARSSLPADQPEMASLTGAVPALNWQERELQDLFGVRLVGHPNPRRCALHDDWPEVHPLRKDFDLRTVLPPFEGERHRFREVEGEGVFQVPVGPVHAGIIEPGHFLFSVAGEPVLYLQLRMFYVHKGIEKLFERLPISHGVRLAESISGDSGFAHATAFCHAIESAPPESSRRPAHARCGRSASNSSGSTTTSPTWARSARTWPSSPRTCTPCG
ncbi:MAG: proton-conducting transporter membrane subunit [Verrucomicrobia bacterium]|nr:proton-conducting transporter membrane subunit [Verrucomicrobiota bacterium]